MSTQPDRSSSRSSAGHGVGARDGLGARLRWALLAAATAGALALVSLAERSPDAGDAAPTGAETESIARTEPGHDPARRLGAEFAPLSAEASEALGLAEGTALAVVDVRRDSLAARAGLLPQDIVTAIAGPVGPGTAGTATTAASWEALCAALDERTAGGALDFFVRRDGQTRIVHVSVDPLDDSAAVHDLAHAPDLSQTACV